MIKGTIKYQISREVVKPTSDTGTEGFGDSEIIATFDTLKEAKAYWNNLNKGYRCFSLAYAIKKYCGKFFYKCDRRLENYYIYQIVMDEDGDWEMTYQGFQEDMYCEWFK